MSLLNGRPACELLNEEQCCINAQNHSSKGDDALQSAKRWLYIVILLHLSPGEEFTHPTYARIPALITRVQSRTYVVLHFILVMSYSENKRTYILSSS